MTFLRKIKEVSVILFKTFLEKKKFHILFK